MAQNDEQKARCQFMLAKCEQNQWYNEQDSVNTKTNRYSSNQSKDPDFIAWDGFKALKKYSNTQYYKEAIKECGYFKTYTEETNSK